MSTVPDDKIIGLTVVPVKNEGADTQKIIKYLIGYGFANIYLAGKSIRTIATIAQIRNAFQTQLVYCDENREVFGPNKPIDARGVQPLILSVLGLNNTEIIRSK